MTLDILIIARYFWMSTDIYLTGALYDKQRNDPPAPSAIERGPLPTCQDADDRADLGRHHPGRLLQGSGGGPANGAADDPDGAGRAGRRFRATVQRRRRAPRPQQPRISRERKGHRAVGRRRSDRQVRPAADEARPG